jgi:hypothetical protein
MDKSTYTFPLGGKEVKLTFNWGGVKRLKGLLSADPLVEFGKLKDASAVDIVEFSASVISACGNIPKEEVTAALDELPPTVAIKIGTDVAHAFNDAFAIDGAGGETGTNTQHERAA